MADGVKKVVTADRDFEIVVEVYGRLRVCYRLGAKPFAEYVSCSGFFSQGLNTFYFFLFMSVKNCPKCGKNIPFDASFCAYCGVPLSTPINTHSAGWMIMSFLISLLWFKIDNNPLFPLGFVGGLIIAFWSADVDRAFGKKPLLPFSVLLSLIGVVVGFIVR